MSINIVMTLKVTKEKIDYKSEFTALQKKHINLTNAVKTYITGVDELFKGRPSSKELGQVLASLVIDLEKAAQK